MKDRDLHASLKTEVVSAHDMPGLRLVLTKLTWSKNDAAFSLHAAPSGYTMSGLQMTDLLFFLGFRRGACPFSGRGECYARWFDPRLNVAAFDQAFGKAFASLIGSQGHLQECGFFLPQPEGWGYFHGKESSRMAGSFGSQCFGDGHTSPQSKTMNQSEDEHFHFALSWIEGGSDKGWATHYKPKRMPLSPEIRGVLDFLELQPFDNCPIFDFEQCRWRFMAFEPRGQSESNAETAHKRFDAHAKHFSSGIEHMLAAEACVEEFGMRFLPLQEASTRREEEIARRVTSKTGDEITEGASKGQFDVAISFAGTERELAEKLATIVRVAGSRVFYDNFYKVDLWGKDLVVFFDDIYRKRSRYCVMFISKEYAERMWTTLERRSALARWVEERGNEYILPIRCDNTELPGLPPTIGYVSMAEHRIDEIGAMLIEKLKSSSGG